MTSPPTIDERLERQAIESKKDLSSAVAELMGVCPDCLGKGVLMARIQFTDRRKPCREELRPCPSCNGSGRTASHAP